MEYTWQNKEIKNPQAISALADQLNVSDVIAQLLVEREITSFDDASDFFRPKFSISTNSKNNYFCTNANCRK